MKELDKVLGHQESVLWEGKPQFLPYFISSFIVAAFGLIFLVVGAIPLVEGIRQGEWVLLAFPHFWVGVALVFGVPLYTYLAYKHIHYAITDKRIIFQSGLIGRDFKMVDFDKMTNAEVNVGILDKLFGKNSGSILISTAGTFTYSNKRGKVSKPYQLRHVTNPYKVFKHLKTVSHDVKTDIEYPNKYRPTENPGYGTKYKP